ncbi:putative ribonuclease H-like domain-containing protein [Tanacetum coccineum]
MIRNKARSVAQGHRQEEGIDYEEVFAPMARLFLAYASFMGFLVYQMDVKSALLYGSMRKRLHQAPRAWYETLANYQLGNGFKRGLQVQQKEDGIFISQDKYVDEILKKFNYTNVKSASTPVDLKKPLVKDGDANYVDVHLYRSMIGSLMYLTTSRPDIMFAVCACARFQVTPKTSHLLAVKRIFRYLKGKPTLGLWYSRDSPFELVAYTDSDYCKKQTVVATSTTEAEYVAAASCCGQYSTKGCDVEGFVIGLKYWNNALSLMFKSLYVFVKFCKGLVLQAKRGQDTKIPQSGGPPEKVGDEAVYKELGDRMEMVATTASSLEAKQDRDAQTRIGVDTARHKLNTASIKYGYIKNHKKTVKNKQARTRESEEYKKKP